MTPERHKNLEKNFSRMFWVKALLNVKIMNLVSTLFYIHRGLTLVQVFYTAIIFAAANLIFEVPSSYLADKWGRKKTIMLAIALAVVGVFIQIFATSFAAFMVAFVFVGISFSCTTGTDDALIYDTNKELGQEAHSLSKLGKYHSAQRFLKIFTPLLGALIAKDLVEWQFVLILVIDLVVMISAFFFASRIAEPHHRMDVEKLETGLLADAYKLIRSDWNFVKTILSKTLLFIAIFAVWRFHQKFFIDIGVSIVALGVGWTAFNIVGFVSSRYIHKFLPSRSLSFRINILNNGVTLSILFLTLGAILLPYGYLLLLLMLLAFFAEVTRGPLYSELFNKLSCSHNRATTLSLTNFFKSVLDIPLLLGASMLASININYVFVFALVLCLMGILFFRAPKNIIPECAKV